MATTEFISGNFKYTPVRDVTWNDVPSREWVRYEKRDDCWVRSGYSFINRRATRAEIINTLAGIYEQEDA